MKRWHVALTMTLLLLVAVAPRAQAQAAHAEFSDEWQWAIGMYLWAETIEADTGVGDAIIPIELSIGDAISDLDIAFTAHVEGKKGAWGLGADINYANLGVQLADKVELPMQPPIDVGLTIDFKILRTEWYGNYRLGNERTWYELLAGIRTSRFKNDVELFDGRIEQSAFDESWVDPIVGGRFKTSLGERVAFVFRGDIGGFGAGSDFTWNIQTGFGFKFARQWAFLAEYRVMDTDYDKGEGADRFVYDGREHGLLLGVVFAF
jgi:hypothetical protein